MYKRSDYSKYHFENTLRDKLKVKGMKYIFDITSNINSKRDNYDTKVYLIPSLDNKDISYVVVSDIDIESGRVDFSKEVIKIQKVMDNGKEYKKIWEKEVKLNNNKRIFDDIIRKMS